MAEQVGPGPVEPDVDYELPARTVVEKPASEFHQGRSGRAVGRMYACFLPVLSETKAALETGEVHVYPRRGLALAAVLMSVIVVRAVVPFGSKPVRDVQRFDGCKRRRMRLALSRPLASRNQLALQSHEEALGAASGISSKVRAH